MKVYLIIREHDQYSEVLGVYTTREKAAKAYDSEISRAWKEAAYHRIEEQEVQ